MWKQVVKSLPAKLLNDIVSRLPEGEITLEDGWEPLPFRATITSASGRYQVRMGQKNFLVPVVEAVYLPAEALIEDYGDLCLPLVLTKLSNFVRCPFESPVSSIPDSDSDYSLEFAATDGHRLRLYNFHH